MYLMMLFNKATKNISIVSLFIRKTNHKNNFCFLLFAGFGFYSFGFFDILIFPGYRPPERAAK